MSASEAGITNGVHTSSDRLSSSTNQDAAHFLVCRKRFQGNHGAPCTSRPKGSLSYRDLNFRRGTFCQNPGKEPLPSLSGKYIGNQTDLGFCLMTAPEARSNVAFNLDIAAGTSRE